MITVGLMALARNQQWATNPTGRANWARHSRPPMDPMRSAELLSSSYPFLATCTGAEDWH